MQNPQRRTSPRSQRSRSPRLSVPEPENSYDCPPGMNYQPGYYRQFRGQPIYVKSRCGFEQDRDLNTETSEYNLSLARGGRRSNGYQTEPTNQNDCPPDTYYHAGHFREHTGRPVYINAHCDTDASRQFEEEGREFALSDVFQQRRDRRHFAPLEQNDCPPGTTYQPGRTDTFNGRPYYREGSCQY